MGQQKSYPDGPESPSAQCMGKTERADRASSAGCLLPTSNPAGVHARAIRNPAILHVGIYQSRGRLVTTTPTMAVASLLCCPSITSPALRAAMVAAELPLRGKLRAEATIFSTDPFFLELVYEWLQTLLVQGLILSCRARIAPCSTHGQNCVTIIIPPK